MPKYLKSVNYQSLWHSDQSLKMCWGLCLQEEEFTLVVPGKLMWLRGGEQPGTCVIPGPVFGVSRTELSPAVGLGELGDSGI